MTAYASKLDGDDAPFRSGSYAGSVQEAKGGRGLSGNAEKTQSAREKRARPEGGGGGGLWQPIVGLEAVCQRHDPTNDNNRNYMYENGA
jgi:hypothetical protein